jgi:imidazolonepropionase-like amidohydrolase
MKYECHGHIIADGVSYKDAMARHKSGVDEAYVRSALQKVAAHGIGFYRDGGDKYMVSAFAKKVAGEYGVDYRTPVSIAHKNGCYGAMYGRGFDDMRGFRALVAEAKALGADFVKLTVSGMLDFDGGGRITGPLFSGPELKEAVKIANGEGFRVMAHVNGADNIKAALEAGVDSVEHGFWPDGSVIDCFLQADAVWVPTCAAVHNLIGAGRYSDNVLLNIHAAQKTVLTEAYARGVLIASGSDCGAWRVPQGQGTDDELEVLADMGIAPERGNRAIAERFKRA